MEIEYELSVADMAAFQRFHLKHNTKAKQPNLLVTVVEKGVSVALVVLVFLAYWFFWQRKGDWISGCCTGVIIGLLFTLVLVWLRLRITIRNAIRNAISHYWDREECRWYFTRRRLKLAPDGFEITNELQHVRYSWSVVWLIDSTDRHLFFYVLTSQAHIIPRRAFRDHRHFEDFIDLACRYHKGLPPRKSASTEILDALPAEQSGITLPRQP